MNCSEVRILNAFSKYAPEGHLDKTGFKCAFILLTGFKPSKDDVKLACDSLPFSLHQKAFVDLMTAYLSKIGQPSVEQLWQKIGGDKKGFITIQELHSAFDSQMPKCFDRDVAFELFRELDSDRDGRLSYKDFYECIKFQL